LTKITAILKLIKILKRGENMNDLRVESYNENEVEAKKRLITKRAALAGSAALLTLGLFSLTGCPVGPTIVGGSGSWYNSVEEEGTTTPSTTVTTAPTTTATETTAPATETTTQAATEAITIDPNLIVNPGGSGSWYASVLEIL
jgi:(2Fe-2S) ferredoxin